MENKTNNKDKIFSTAVSLFAKSGYSSVSMRDIASAVGIKASSIYNHFESKEAILESIFDYYVMQLNEAIYIDLDNEDLSDPELLLSKNLGISMALFQAPIMNDIIRIITREQLSNKRIREFLLVEMIEKPRKKFTEIFTKLIEDGSIKPFDPKLLANEYQAFAISQYFRNSILIESSQLDLQKDEAEQNAHLKFFWNAVKKQEESI